MTILKTSRKLEFLLLAFSIAVAPALSRAQACRLADLARDCTIFDGPESAQGIKLSDGTIIPHPMVNLRDVALTSPTHLKKRSERVVFLFNFAKEALLSEVSGGRAPAKLSPERRAMFDKVSAVRLRSNDESSKDESCSKQPRDAFFSPSTNKVTVCPGFLNFPDSALIEVLGHEIGHSVDFCNSQLPVVSLNKEKIAELGTDRAKFPDEIRNDPERASLAIDIGKLAHESQSSAVLRDVKYLDQPDRTLKYFEGKDVLRQVAAGVTHERNPYENLYSCLQKETGSRRSTSRDLKTVSKNYITWLERQRDLRGREKFAVRAKIEAVAGKYPECTDLQGSSQMSEMSADVWGTLALARWIALNPPRTPSEKLAPLASFLVSFCREKKMASKANGSLDQILEANSYAMKSRHPASRIRADKIHLTEKRIQTALGCEPVDKAECFHKFNKPDPPAVQQAAEASSRSQK